MNQSAAKFVVSNQESLRKIVEESKLQFVIENFAKLPENKIEVSPKIELFSVDADWWTNVSKNEFEGPYTHAYNYTHLYRNSHISKKSKYLGNCKIEVHVKAKPGCILKSANFIAKGTIDGIEVLCPGVITLFNAINEEEFNEEGMIKVEIPIDSASCSGAASNKLASVISSGGSLVIDFSLSVELDCEEKSKNKFCDTSVIKNQIVANVSQLLIDSKYSDFEFIVKRSKFKVHKAILGPVSEVFANLFASEMEESKTNKCKVPHLNPIAFGHMLKFIYSAKPPEDFNADVALRLFEVAHYYDIKPLMKVCEQEVLFGLNAENALEMFKLAQLYDLEEMKQKSWVIVKRDVLKINRRLKQEPLTLEAIDELLDLQKREAKFYEKF